MRRKRNREDCFMAPMILKNTLSNKSAEDRKMCQYELRELERHLREQSEL